ncbi:MAG TPA: hypothetical protein VN372_04645 [Methanospirillum sp.]|nr:hypothetical protein [Methanospirillum sp.]
MPEIAVNGSDSSGAVSRIDGGSLFQNCEGVDVISTIQKISPSG